MNHSNPLDPQAIQIVTKEEVSKQFYQVRGDEISWTKVQPSNSVTFSTDSNSHKYTFLGLYTKANALKYGIDIQDGGLDNTMLEDIYDAYFSTGLWVGSLSPSSYRASIMPNVKLTIPITGGTGTLSGLTSLNLYTSMCDSNVAKTSDGGGSCACWLVDSYKSEALDQATYLAGIGYAYDPGNNPSQTTNQIYRSGVAFLFANEIYFSGNTGTTWDTGWSAATPYTYGGHPLAKFSGTDKNRAVGVMHLDTGLVTLWNSDIVTSFNEAIATGGTSTTGLTFNTVDSNIVMRDYDQTTTLNINTPLYPYTFENSPNQSKLDAKAAGINCKNKVYITRLCYLNSRNEIMAVATLDTPIEKNSEDFAMVVATASMDGGIKVAPDEDGTHTVMGYPSGL